MEIIVIMILLAAVIAEERYKRQKIETELAETQKVLDGVNTRLKELESTCVYLQLNKRH